MKPCISESRLIESLLPWIFAIALVIPGCDVIKGTQTVQKAFPDNEIANIPGTHEYIMRTPANEILYCYEAGYCEGPCGTPKTIRLLPAKTVVDNLKK